MSSTVNLEERVRVLEEAVERHHSVEKLMSRLEGLELAFKAHHDAILAAVRSAAQPPADKHTATPDKPMRIDATQSSNPLLPAKEVTSADSSTQTFETASPAQPTPTAPRAVPPAVRTRLKKSGSGLPSPLGRSPLGISQNVGSPEEASKLAAELRQRKAAFAAESGGGKRQPQSLALLAAKRQAAKAAAEAQKSKQQER
jgi:hypothetical protein